MHPVHSEFLSPSKYLSIEKEKGQELFSWSWEHSWASQQSRWFDWRHGLNSLNSQASSNTILSPLRGSKCWSSWAAAVAKHVPTRSPQALCLSGKPSRALQEQCPITTPASCTAISASFGHDRELHKCQALLKVKNQRSSKETYSAAEGWIILRLE